MENNTIKDHYLVHDYYKEIWDGLSQDELINMRRARDFPNELMSVYSNYMLQRFHLAIAGDSNEKTK